MPPNPTVSLVSTSFGMVSLAYIPFIYIFYLRMSKHPIKGRYPKLVLTFLTFFLFSMVIRFFTTIYGNEKLCALRILVGGIFNFSGPLWYVYRLIRLLFATEVTNVIKNLKSNRNSENLILFQENWFIRYRFIVRTKIAFISYGIIVSMHVLYNILFLIFIEGYATATDNACFIYNLPILTYTFTTGLGGCLLCVLSFVVLVRMKAEDAFSIRTEIKATLFGLLAVVLSLIIYTVSNITGPFLFDTIAASYASLSYTFFVHYIFITALFIPLYASHVEEKRSLQAKECMDMDEVIKHPIGYKYFLEYLQLEFASESLLFWREVEDYRELASSSSAATRDTMLEIYDRYVAETAPFRVILSSDVTRDMEQKLQGDFLEFSISSAQTSPRSQTEETGNLESVPLANISGFGSQFVNFFDEAQREVTQVLLSDPYPRFLRTDFYQKFTASLGHAEAFTNADAFLSRTEFAFDESKRGREDETVRSAEV